MIEVTREELRAIVSGVRQKERERFKWLERPPPNGWESALTMNAERYTMLRALRLRCERTLRENPMRAPKAKVVE